jgi:methionine-rich copper-binding protein CopC
MQVRPDSVQLAVGDAKTVIATFGTALAPGRYTVRWQVSGDDGHPVRGEFSFDVIR